LKSSTAGSAGSVPPPPAAARASDLKIRFLSALVLGPLVLAAVWIGGWVFRLLLVVGAVLAVREWVLMVAGDRAARPLVASYAGTAAVLAAYVFTGPLFAFGVAVAFWPLVGFFADKAERGLTGLGVPYVAAGVIGLGWLREDPSAGLGLFLFALLAVWATDIGAYAAGRSIGGPKLAPRISPKKTWAGLIGGAIAAALFGWGVAMADGAAVPALALGVAGLLAVVSQIGDLFESWVKRRFDVKDSGTLIPGHGGLLDRIDGLLVAAPVLAVFHATAGARLAWW